MPISRASFWDDVLAGRAFNVRDDLATIGKPVDRGRWGMTPPTSDAYYNPLLNEIVFPAGILQPPAFSMDANDAVNYGAIGVVIGHEISHGFDDQGAQYDAQGRLSNWWTPEDLKKFQTRTACVVAPVRRLLRRARPPSQRSARARREHRRSRRREDRISSVPDFPARQAAVANDRRIYPGAAVLHCLGTVPRRRRAAGVRADDGAGGSASDRQVPRDRTAVEPAGVSSGVFVQAGRAHGAPGGGSLRSMVSQSLNHGSLRSNRNMWAERIAPIS